MMGPPSMEFSPFVPKEKDEDEFFFGGAEEGGLCIRCSRGLYIIQRNNWDIMAQSYQEQLVFHVNLKKLTLILKKH